MTAVELLRVLDGLNQDAQLARAAYSAAMGMHMDEEREPNEQGLICLLELLADRLDEHVTELVQRVAAQS